MIHRNFVATILTILLVSTIPVTLLSYNNNPSSEITIFSNYNFVYGADKAQTDKGDDQRGSPESGNNIPSEASAEKLQQKVRELMLEASNARIRAAKAMNAAGNVTEVAESLSTIADEADKDVKRLFKSVGDVEKQEQKNNETTAAQVDNNINNNNNNDNDELNAALLEAKQKRKAANQAETDARDLSDKANSLNEAAKKS